jgi:mRNA interferase RelE/StbE
MTPSKGPLYTVQFRRPPEKLLRRLPKDLVERISQAIDDLAVTPRPPGMTQLVGYDYLYRIRVGDWRIIYTIEDDQLIVLVIDVAHRGNVYRNL